MKTLCELIEQATPGPWISGCEDAIDYRPEQVFNPVIGSRVAVMSGGGPTRAVCGPEERANAELIARCSPATMLLVLEALEKLSESAGKGGRVVEYSIANKALAALNGGAQP